MFSKILAFTLSTLGAFAATLGSQGCMLIVFDEPEMPKCMVK